MIWLITDTHFGHANMIPYCGRPEGFSSIILNNMFKMIKPEDVLIHLGDICMGKDSLWHERLRIIDCKKILVRGNHDKKSDSWYMSHGWDFVCDSFSIKFMGKDIIFSHAPVPLNQHDLNIHGHLHNNLHRPQEFDDGKHILLSVENSNYKPVLLNTLISHIM